MWDEIDSTHGVIRGFLDQNRHPLHVDNTGVNLDLYSSMGYDPLRHIFQPMLGYEWGPLVDTQGF